jgi:hypothetical protein
MHSRCKSILTGCLTLLTWAAVAQDAPLGALPTQFNPAFAGEAGSPRISSSFVYRTLPESKPVPNTQMMASYPYRMFGASTAYDQFVPALRSGVGIATSHTQGATPYYTNQVHSVWPSRPSFRSGVSIRFPRRSTWNMAGCGSPAKNIRWLRG